jgi:type IV pilus assembly protein PilA
MLNSLAKLREERAEGENGFTLIELLVVVVIIGILIAIAIPLYLNYKKGANDKAAESDLRGAISTLEQCNSNNNVYPSSITVGTSGGACTGQTITASSGTTITYFAATGGANYIIESTNSSGSGAKYCYDSAVGGSVASVTSAIVSAYAATCPA